MEFGVGVGAKIGDDLLLTQREVGEGAGVKPVDGAGDTDEENDDEGQLFL